MGFLKGGSKTRSQSQSRQESASNSYNRSLSRSRSFNEAYPFIAGNFRDYVSTGNNAIGSISDLFNLGGVPGDGRAQAAFDNYLNSTGYGFMRDQGVDSIAANQAAAGLLNSGSTLKGIQRFGTNLAAQYYDNYIGRLLDIAGSGLGAGQLITDAGRRSESFSDSVGGSNSYSTGTSTSSGTGRSSPGLGGLLGGIGSVIAASDPRLKMDLEPLYKRRDGVTVYSFRYINGAGPYIGVMADEVSRLRPDALGPEIGGFKTVDYSKLDQ